MFDKVVSGGGLVVIKDFSIYSQCFVRCEDVSNFPNDWGKAMIMDLDAHDASYIIDTEYPHLGGFNSSYLFEINFLVC